MLALCRCAQTSTVLREFVRPGWTCLQGEAVAAGIIASAFALAHQLGIGRQQGDSLEATNGELVEVQEAIAAAKQKHNAFLKELGLSWLP